MLACYYYGGYHQSVIAAIMHKTKKSDSVVIDLAIE